MFERAAHGEGIAVRAQFPSSSRDEFGAGHRRAQQQPDEQQTSPEDQLGTAFDATRVLRLRHGAVRL